MSSHSAYSQYRRQEHARTSPVNLEAIHTCLVVQSPSWKWKIKNVPNHQSVLDYGLIYSLQLIDLSTYIHYNFRIPECWSCWIIVNRHEFMIVLCILNFREFSSSPQSTSRLVLQWRLPCFACCRVAWESSIWIWFKTVHVLLDRIFMLFTPIL
jgi:hypothetical protein